MKRKGLIQGALIATICIIISKIIGIIYVIPFYSIIGSKGGALYGYAYSIYSIFLTISSVGIPLAISRLTSEYDSLDEDNIKKRTFMIARKVITFLSVTSFIILFVFAPAIAYFFIGNIKGGNTIEDVTFVIRVISTAILVVPTLSVTKGYLQGHGYISVSSISQVLEQIFRVIIIIVGSYIAINVFHLSITIGVGVATFGATFGGLIAYLYVKYKMHKHKLNFKIKDKKEDSKLIVSDKYLAMRIIGFSFAFVFSSLALSFYDLINFSSITKEVMINSFHYSVNEVEQIISIFSTWGFKLESIIIAFASGLLVSLIPSITNSFVNNDLISVRDKINKSLQLLLYLTIPITIALSLFSSQIWTLFYQYDLYSSNVFMYYIYFGLFSGILLAFNAIMQSLNFQKQMIINILIGFLVKIILHIPLMYIFNVVGLNASHGMVTSTILGFLTSIILCMILLRKRIAISYKKTFIRTLKIINCSLLTVIITLLVEYIIPISAKTRLSSMLALILYGGVATFVYLFSTYKMRIVSDILGDDFISKSKDKFMRLIRRKK